MYDVNYWKDGEDYTERFDDENEARERFEKLVYNRECAWIELVKLINNWSIED
jgi:hypothetical protein